MTLLAKKLYQRIPALMNVLIESFNSAQPNDISAAIPDLGTFFLKVLQFREDISNSPDDMEVDETELTLKDVVVVEESVSKALVALVLKLSETTFRPFYYKLYDWAARNPQYKERNITFYRLIKLFYLSFILFCNFLYLCVLKLTYGYLITDKSSVADFQPT